MKNKENDKKPVEHTRRWNRFLQKRPGLQLRMTISYVVVSVTIALLVELLLVGIFFFVILRLPFVDQNTQNVTEQTAQYYALEAALQANGDTLNPFTTFQPGQTFSLVASTNASSQAPTFQFELLIAPNGQVVASSNPSSYPPSAFVAKLLPNKAQLVRDALAGKARNNTEVTAEGHVFSLAQPILSRENKAIGVIYIQALSQTFSPNVFGFVGGLFFTALFWLALTTPIGAIFGFLTTRGMVRRLHRLVAATGQFAEGDYTQRVPTKKQDEIGLLERQFNTMAEQLVESITQQKSLVEQHARQEERARIEQEMHTAQLIQLSLLPKEQPTLPSWQIASYYQAAREVGG